jgi:beta-glucosidase
MLKTAALVLCAGVLQFAAAPADAQTPTTQPTTAPTRAPTELADEPAPKTDKNGNIQARFEQLHESFLKRAKAGPIGVLFLGDSITEGWARSAGATTIWDKYYGNDQPANFGIGGDQTQHVLWRIDNGELDGISPKVLVLMIGTNNIRYSADHILAGDTKIVDEIHAKLPNTKLLLLGIFPRGAKAGDPSVAEMREKIKTVNQGLAKLDDGGKTTKYLDIGVKFLDPDGNIDVAIMKDALHPTPAGYQIWADAMQPTLDELLK